MQVKITIRMDNEAFGDDECSRANEMDACLRRCLRDLSHGRWPASGDQLKIRDSNGNTVGEMTVED